MPKGSIALLLAGMATLALGPAAGAQTEPPLFEGVEVTPSEVSTPSTVVTITGPPREDAVGCASANIQGIPRSGSSGVVSLGITDANIPDPSRSDGQWAYSFRADTMPLAAVTYDVEILCVEQPQGEQRFRTGQTLTVTNAATTIPTTSSTTTTAPAPTTTTLPSVDGSVDPTTAKPGETTITVRGGGFKANAPLQISLATNPVTALATAKADAFGFYASTLKLPVNAPPGTHQIVVTGPAPDDTTRTTTATLTVQDLDCADFATPEAAQAALAGGRDPHGLDGNKDGVACNGVSARTAAGVSGGAPATPAGTLPQTGADHTELGIMVGLTAMTLGALLVGLSHPAEPAAPSHHRRHRRRRR